MLLLDRLSAEALAASLPGAVVVWDPEGRVVWANAGARRLVGSGKVMAALLPGFDWCHALQGGEGTADLPAQQVRVAAAPLRGDSATVVGGVALLTPLGAPASGACGPAVEVAGPNGPFASLVGSSPAMRELRRLGALAARSLATVLLLGESGTGKELLARAIHQASARQTGPFVAVNCAAVPEGLLEAEFFGYAEGAFTGARPGGKPGKFQLAEGGTLFLDEIGDLAPALQAKLLRALQEREVEPVGATRPLRVDVRVIAASNRDLQAMVERGAFRADLFYRLNVLTLHLPPLREHLADLPAMAEHVLRRLGATARLTPGALTALRAYHWPGNVRELENVLERAVALGSGAAAIGPEAVPGLGTAPGPSPPSGGGQRSAWRHRMREVERDALLGALKRTGGNKSAAARLLGLSRSQFYAKLGALNR